MERILPGILVVVTLLACGGDGLQQPNPLAHRYGGGGLRRPPYGGNARGHHASYVSASGGHHGSAGPAGSGSSYGSASVPSNAPHGGGGHRGAHNAPTGGLRQVHQYSSGGGGGYGQAAAASYNRPFGVPEGQKFPYGGFTYKVPAERPPSPPIRSSYKSKPYPDFIVRFKSPLYPSEVAPHGGGIGISSGGAGGMGSSGGKLDPPPYRPPMPTAMPNYEPGEPFGEWSLFGGDGSSGGNSGGVSGGGGGGGGGGVNVGASYQTGGNPPVYVNQALGVGGMSEQAMPSVHSFVEPPSSSIYILKGVDEAADKSQVDKSDQSAQSQPNSFVELSKESVFGATQEPGVIKPLTPDVVYSPDKSADFKPMYIFGPVYFPKTDGEAADAEGKEAASSAVESQATVTAKSEEVVECIEQDPKDPKCNLKSANEAVAAVTQNSTAAAAAASEESTTVKPKKAAGGGGAPKASAASDVAEDDAEADGGGGSRGLIGVLKGILGVDGNSRDDEDYEDDDEHLTRGDTKKKTKGSSRPTDDETADREDGGNNRPPKRRRRPNASSSSSNTRNTNDRKGTQSNSRYIPSHKKFSTSGSGGGDNRGPRPLSSIDYADDSENQGGEADQFNVSGEKKQDTAVDPANSEVRRPPALVQPDQSIEGGGNDLREHALEGNDDPDPVVGPVQIGFIGRPPPGANHNHPYQPFFYPAGIPAFEHNPLGQDFPQIGHHRPNPGNGENIRRHFDESSDMSVNNHVRNTRPVYGGNGEENSMDAPLKSSSFYEGFQQQGYRDYASGIPYQEDQEPADSSSSQVTEKNSNEEVDDHVKTSDASAATSSTTEYVRPVSVTEDESLSASTYPRTSSYHDVTTAYDDQLTSSQTTSHLSSEAVSHASGSASASESESDSTNIVTEHSPPSSTLFYNDSDHVTNNVSTPSPYGKHIYASVTRRPFPSFYKYRTSYRPKLSGGGGGGGDDNYIAPTTYRPASFRLSSTTPRPTSVRIDHGLDEEKDVSATIHNSVQDDHYATTTSSSADSSRANIAQYHSMETANSEALVQIHEFPTDAPYGSRISAAAAAKRNKLNR